MPARLPATLVACLLALPAAAQQLPPADGMPLSRLVAGLEAREDLGAITEIEWDDDGYWEVDVLSLPEGRKVELRLDPFTGAELGRRGH